MKKLIVVLIVGMAISPILMAKEKENHCDAQCIHERNVKEQEKNDLIACMNRYIQKNKTSVGWREYCK